MTKKNFLFALVLSAVSALVFLNVVVFTEILHFNNMLLATIITSVVASFIGLIWIISLLIKNKYERPVRVVLLYIIVSVAINLLVLQGYLELFYKLFFNLGAGF